MAKKAKRGFLAKLGARLSGKRNAPAFDTAGHGRQLRGFTPGISGPNVNLVAGPASMRDRSRDLIGPMTLAAINGYVGQPKLLAMLKEQAKAYYIGLNKPHYIKGWLRRLES